MYLAPEPNGRWPPAPREIPLLFIRRGHRFTVAPYEWNRLVCYQTVPLLDGGILAAYPGA